MAPDSAGHLDLHKVVALAEQVGGLNHGFRCAAGQDLASVLSACMHTIMR